MLIILFNLSGFAFFFFVVVTNLFLAVKNLFLSLNLMKG
jgi:hypothetical protein